MSEISADYVWFSKRVSENIAGYVWFSRQVSENVIDLGISKFQVY